jgi:hypothetical protein
MFPADALFSQRLLECQSSQKAVCSLFILSSIISSIRLIADDILEIEGASLVDSQCHFTLEAK